MADVTADTRVAPRPSLDQGMNFAAWQSSEGCSRSPAFHRLFPLQRHFRVRLAGTHLPAFCSSAWHS